MNVKCNKLLLKNVNALPQRKWHQLEKGQLHIHTVILHTSNASSQCAGLFQVQILSYLPVTYECHCSPALLPPVSIAPATTCSLFWVITLRFSLLYLHRAMSSAVNQSFQIWAMWLDVFKSKSVQQIQQSLELWKCFLFICVLFFPRWFSPSYYSSSSHGGPVLSLSTTSTTTVAPQPIIWWSLLVLPTSSSLPCHLSFWRSATGSFVLVSGPHSCTDGTLQKLWRCT